MANDNPTPPAKQLVATLPFRSEQIGFPDANYDVSVWRGADLVCEKQSHSPCDTSGLFYGSAEDEVTKFCARHFYEMHGVPGPTYRLVDAPDVDVPTLALEAEDAFWQVLADRFPYAQSGDLFPERTVAFAGAAEAAVREWVAANVPGAAGRMAGHSLDTNTGPGQPAGAPPSPSPDGTIA